MKEHKFKVWDKYEKKWVDLTKWIIVFCFEGFHLEDIGGNEILSKDVELVEYIGRKDKKGEALYQGDIVIWDDPVYAGEYGPGVIGWVDWPGISGFAITDGKGNLHKDGNYGYDVGFDFEQTEKIGNICEDPQLMKVKR